MHTKKYIFTLKMMLVVYKLNREHKINILHVMIRKKFIDTY